ncbi:MAG: cytochrome c biogenesis protein ResB [Alcaligenaceae bacterium]|nr:cytochrome c biogenesis protein ResB [Alcaligenaceae bacterium]
MRFAVSLLSFICVASIIGTVLQQNQTDLQYTDQFGTFWYTVFSKFGVAQIYNTWWFLVIMGFLVISTTVCLIRNTPKMVKDMRSFREYIREGSLRAFPHKINVDVPHEQETAIRMSKSWLKKEGYTFKEKVSDNGILLAAKKGSSNKLGYIFAHVAIVVICIGGLLDSELPNRLQIWFGGKAPIPATAKYISDVTDSSRFSTSNPSFRGNVLITEGNNSSFALLGLGGEQYLQVLPFDIKLNKFIIEYYQTNGMPKRFASDVTITDLATKEVQNQIIEVNHPFTMHGITLYQSSFDDGGSKLQLTGYPVKGAGTETFELSGEVGGESQLTTTLNGRQQVYRVRFDDFSPINVENLNAASDEGMQPKSFQDQVVAVTGSAASKEKEVQNIGPSVSYTLFDDKNQAIKYNNYMLPVPLDNTLVFLAGIQLPGEGMFRYIRIPADEKATMNEFMALQAAFDNPGMREKAAQIYAEKVRDGRIDPATVTELAKRALAIFARGGFNGIDQYVDGESVPEAERIPENLREPMKRILREYLLFSAIELRNLVRAENGLPAVEFSEQEDAEKQARWFDLSLRAMSDFNTYPAPVMLQLKTFEHIQASVLQATRSPGKWIVYLGSLFLMIGVFAMFYIKDRRIWMWIKPGTDANSSKIMSAMTSQKRTLDFNREFERFRQDFSGLAKK